MEETSALPLEGKSVGVAPGRSKAPRLAQAYVDEAGLRETLEPWAGVKDCAMELATSVGNSGVLTQGRNLAIHRHGRGSCRSVFARFWRLPPMSMTDCTARHRRPQFAA